MKQNSAYLLVSHGSRDPRPQAAIDDLAQLVTAQLKHHQTEDNIQSVAQPVENALGGSSLGGSVLSSDEFQEHRVQGGQFQGDRPTLTEVLAQPQITVAPLIATAVLELHPLPLHEQICCFAEQAIAYGYGVVQILPLFLLAGIHVTKDIPAEVAIAQTKLGDRIVLDQSPHVGSYRSVQNLIVDAFEVPTKAKGATQILLAHGSRRSQGNAVIEAIAQRIGARTAYWSVPPSLESQVTALLEMGCREIAVLPYFLFAGGITDAIAQTVADLAMQFPDVCFQLAQPLGVNPTFANQLADLMKG